MNEFPAEYLPKGPASSYRLRAYAEQCYREYISTQEDTADKYSFIKSMEFLNRRLLGMESGNDSRKNDQNKHQGSRTMPSLGFDQGRGSLPLYGQESSSNDRKPDSSTLKLTEDMKAASISSLEKIKALRNQFLSSIDVDKGVWDQDNSTNFDTRAAAASEDHYTPREPSISIQPKEAKFASAMDEYQYKPSLKKSVRFDSEVSSDAEDSESNSVVSNLQRDNDEDEDDESSVSSSTTTSSGNLPSKAMTSAKMFVRVLWDLENIAVPRRIGGLNVVERIRDFLAKKGLLGPGIDTRITGFFSPEHKSMSSKTVEELDKAGVELVWVSTKREDADRKIGYRISQETHVLKDYKNTVFVIISSDQDFRHHMLLLLNEGYRVIVIHNAPPGKWTKSLEMQASEAYKWQEDVFGGSFPQKKKKSSATKQVVEEVVISPSAPQLEMQDDSILSKVSGSSNDSLQPPIAPATTATASIEPNSRSKTSIELMDASDIVAKPRAPSPVTEPALKPQNTNESNKVDASPLIPKDFLSTTFDETIEKPIHDEKILSELLGQFESRQRASQDQHQIRRIQPSFDSPALNDAAMNADPEQHVSYASKAAMPVRARTQSPSTARNHRQEPHLQSKKAQYNPNNTLKTQPKAIESESVDLSNMTFEKLKELTGHY